MTTAKLQELAREAGISFGATHIGPDGEERMASVTDGDLTRFAAIVRAATLEEAAQALERETLQKRRLYAGMNAVEMPPCSMATVVRALAQRAGVEQASRGTIPADRRHDAGG